MSPSERIDALLAGATPEVDEQRLARLIYELQAARPTASDALRSRIDTLAATESVRRPSLLGRLTLRRALLVLAPAVVAVSLGAAVVQGIVTASSPTEQTARPQPQTRDGGGVREDAAPGAFSDQGLVAPQTETFNALSGRARFPETSPGRAQDYRADLRVRVDDLDDLSDRTKDVLRLTRSYGGYVVSTDYRNPRAGEGDSTFELRIPIGRVQQALVGFSGLGAIVSQNVFLKDLQGQIDRWTRDIRRLRDQMARLRSSLLDPDLTAAERARIETQLAEARAGVASLEQQRRLLQREGRFAKISLALTTKKPAAKEETPGRIERAFDDAGSVLAREVAFGLYALIVASPFLLLAALAIAGARAGRRRADQRLLERA